MDDEKHYPPGAEPEKAAEVEAPQKDDAPEDAPASDEEEEDESETGEEEETQAEKPKEEADKPEEPTQIKKRSIYDDLKDKKHEVKSEKARADAAEAKAAELQALIDAKDTAETPAEKKEAAKDIKEYADKHGLDADGVEELANIITAKLPKQEGVLTAEEAAQWRADRAKSARAEEDRAILNTAPTVKQELSVSDDAELAKVMDEVVRLAHTPEFHDKEVDYIIWKNKAALSKLVSPKRASFEQGGQRGEAEAEREVDFSSTKGITPEMAGRPTSKRAPTLEVRRGSNIL